MFEVDWTDYDKEQVGQRRARKEAERQLKKKEEARSSHGTTSTRASASSNQHHLSFFGSISRKKTIASSVKGKKQEPTTPKSETAKSDGKLKRSSFFFPRAARGSATEPADDDTIKEETERTSTTRPFVAAKSAAEPKDHNKLASPDRSSKASMLSKMTQLTIPTLDFQRRSAIADPATTTRFVQELDDDSSFVAKTVTTTYQTGGNKFSLPSQVGVDTKITASPMTPRTPKLLHSPHPLSSPETDKSASEAIDDWYTALHGPARQLPRPGPNGTIRRGNVLLPPNVHRPVPVTPTRRSTKRTSLMPPNPSPIRFLADDPSDWKTPDEWNSTPSTGMPFSSPINHRLDEQEDEAAPDSATSTAEDSSGA